MSFFKRLFGKKDAPQTEEQVEEKKSLDEQLNVMIGIKYQFMNYNGLRTSHLKDLTDSWRKNPFDDTVVIIDEAHNFISRIVNKLKNNESVSCCRA